MCDVKKLQEVRKELLTDLAAIERAIEVIQRLENAKPLKSDEVVRSKLQLTVSGQELDGDDGKIRNKNLTQNVRNVLMNASPDALFPRDIANAILNQGFQNQNKYEVSKTIRTILVNLQKSGKVEKIYDEGNRYAQYKWA